MTANSLTKRQGKNAFFFQPIISTRRHLLSVAYENGNPLLCALRHCQLASGLSLEDFTELLASVDGAEFLCHFLGNPRNDKNLEMANGVLEAVARLLLLIGRRCQLAQTLISMTEIIDQVQWDDHPVSDEHNKQMAARIQFYVDELISSLEHRNVYIHRRGEQKDCVCSSVDKGVLGLLSDENTICYDVQMLIFEFSNNIKLRANQVKLVEKIVDSVHRDEPLCVQLMMGQGKTTVGTDSRVQFSLYGSSYRLLPLYWRAYWVCHHV